MYFRPLRADIRLLPTLRFEEPLTVLLTLTASSPCTELVPASEPKERCRATAEETEAVETEAT